MNYTMKLSKKIILGEEIANSVTHAVGALLMPDLTSDLSSL